MTKQQIFKLITATRKEKGITQLELANLCKIKESTLIRNIQSENEMTLGTLLNLCEVLEMQITIT